MKVSGFSFIRNAIIYDYPVVESILSILPVVDEFVIAVGSSDDDTLGLIESIQSDKIRIIQTQWDDKLRQGGRVLAEETNKAFQAISPDTDWAFYIQADEVVHEKYLERIRKAMQKYEYHEDIEGLLFNYLHFYGSYDYIGDSRKWYRREIRIVRNDPRIQSYKDAQGFRIEDRKLRVKLIDAYIYHYGWVKHPLQQQEKQRNFNKYWHDEDWLEKNIPNVKEFNYSNIDSLSRFQGSHPKVLKQRIKAINWKFLYDPDNNQKIPMKYKILKWLDTNLNYRPGEYRNYIIV